MERYEEILNIIPDGSKELVCETVKEAVFLEEKLKYLKELPFIEIHPQNPMKQRSTPAAKMYKEFLQQYNNCIKLLEAVVYRDKRLEGEDVEESPLRKWWKENVNTE